MAASPNEWIFYGECMRNHAMMLGLTIIDGCCEFTLNQKTPNFLLCEACGCHRNFHRRIPFTDSVNQGDNNQQRTEQVVHDGESGRQQQQQQQQQSKVVLALAPPRKRVRTLFTREQKERMRIFAEDLQWKMVKNRRHEIDCFCHEIGVPRQNFKMWMQNHKRTCTSLELAYMAHPEPASGSGTPIIVAHPEPASASASASASGTPDIASSYRLRE